MLTGTEDGLLGDVVLAAAEMHWDGEDCKCIPASRDGAFDGAFGRAPDAECPAGCPAGCMSFSSRSRSICYTTVPPPLQLRSNPSHPGASHHISSPPFDSQVLPPRSTPSAQNIANAAPRLETTSAHALATNQPTSQPRTALATTFVSRLHAHSSPPRQLHLAPHIPICQS